MKLTRIPPKTNGILMIMDFTPASYAALRYAVSIATENNEVVHICHIGSLGNIEGSENQAVVMRSLRSQVKNVEKKLSAFEEIVRLNEVKVSYHAVVGNFKSEIKNLINKIHPGLIVMGKTKEKAGIDSKLSSFLLHKYEGSLLFVEQEMTFKNDTKVALACNQDTLYRYDPENFSSINISSTLPLTLVNINTSTQAKEYLYLPKKWQVPRTMSFEVQFESKEDNGVVNGLKEQIKKHQIELLCIGRGKRPGFLENLFSRKDSVVKQIINNISIPILVMGSYLRNSNQSNYDYTNQRNTSFYDA